MTYEQAINKLTESFGAMAAVDIAMAIASRNTSSGVAKAAKAPREKRVLELVDVDKSALEAFTRDYLAAKAAYASDKSAYSTLARRLGFANPMALGAIARTGKATADGAKLLADTYGATALNAPAKRARKVK